MHVLTEMRSIVFPHSPLIPLALSPPPLFYPLCQAPTILLRRVRYGSYVRRNNPNPESRQEQAAEEAAAFRLM